MKVKCPTCDRAPVEEPLVDVTPSVAEPSAPVLEPTTRLDSTAPIAHNASCDLCDSQIQGTRYKCLNCPDWG
jgi:hypothetical protein